MEIPLNAQVECADGPCGKTIAIIADPETRSVTHVVIEPPGLDARLVPLDLVAETTHDLVRLRCTQAELAETEQFIETHYVDKGGPDYTGASFGADPYAFEATYASYTPETVPVGSRVLPTPVCNTGAFWLTSFAFFNRLVVWQWSPIRNQRQTGTSWPPAAGETGMRTRCSSTGTPDGCSPCASGYWETRPKARTLPRRLL